MLAELKNSIRDHKIDNSEHDYPHSNEQFHHLMCITLHPEEVLSSTQYLTRAQLFKALLA